MYCRHGHPPDDKPLESEDPLYIAVARAKNNLRLAANNLFELLETATQGHATELQKKDKSKFSFLSNFFRKKTKTGLLREKGKR